MDIYTYLKKDHKKVSDLMELVASTNIGEREALFEQIKHELTLHADTEEPTFYAAIEKASRTKSAEEKVEHAEKEHEEVRDYLAKLSAIDIKSAEWLVCFGELKHAVTHHVEEEEGEIFEKAKKYLSKEQAEQLAEDMDALKQEQKAQKQAV